MRRAEKLALVLRGGGVRAATSSTRREPSIPTAASARSSIAKAVSASPIPGSSRRKRRGRSRRSTSRARSATSVCVQGAAPPADAPAKLSTIVAQKSELIVDGRRDPAQGLPRHARGVPRAAVAAARTTARWSAPSPRSAICSARWPTIPTSVRRCRAWRCATATGRRRPAAGLVHTIVNYPNIDDFIGKTLALIAPGGTAEAEWKQLLTAGSMALTTVQPVADADDPKRTLRLALNLMTSTHPDLATGTARPLVTRDYRGLAMASTVNGKVQAPFVDKDGDGLADVDAMGHFVDANGNVLDACRRRSPSSARPTRRRATRRAARSPPPTRRRRSTSTSTSTARSSAAWRAKALKLMDPHEGHHARPRVGHGRAARPARVEDAGVHGRGAAACSARSPTTASTRRSRRCSIWCTRFVQLLGDPNADQTLPGDVDAAQQLRVADGAPHRRHARRQRSRQEASGSAWCRRAASSTTISCRSSTASCAVPGLAEDLMDALQDPRVKDLAPMIARLMRRDNQVDFVHATGTGLSAPAERATTSTPSIRSIAPSPTSTTTARSCSASRTSSTTPTACSSATRRAPRRSVR